MGQDRHREYRIDDDRIDAVSRGRSAGPDLAANVVAAQRAAERSRTGGVWSLGHLRICWIALVSAGAVLVIAAVLASGGRAVAGVALGTVIVGIFFSFSAVVIAKAGQVSPKLVMVAALSAYVFKIVALGVVLTFMPRDGVFDTRWMSGAIGLGLFVWLGAHMRYVWTTKVYYVDPH